MSIYNDYSVRIRRTKTNLRTFFEVVLYDMRYKVIEEVAARNRIAAYLSTYKLVVKHCTGLPLYDRFYLTMRLIGYYLHLVW